MELAVYGNNEFDYGLKHPGVFAADMHSDYRHSNHIHREPEMKLIDGCYINSNLVIAHCRCSKHPGYLSKKLVKAHNCLKKKCRHFEKMNDEYWKTAERKEQAKQLKKTTRLEAKIAKKEANAKNRDREIIIREALEKSGHIHVTSIRQEGEYQLSISYIYDRDIDLYDEMKYLREKLGSRVFLNAVVGTEQAIENLIRKPRRETCKVTDLRKAPKVGYAMRNRLFALGVYCIEDLFGRSGEELYRIDCELSGEKVNRRYLNAYCSAVEYAKTLP